MHGTLATPSDRRKGQDALKEVLGDLMPPSHAIQLGHAERVELDTERKFRTKNKASYRLNHWPIWIWSFFIAPGPLTFDLFAHGFDWRMAAWLGVVLVATGVAGYFGQLPGVEPAPYIIRFTEDRPNPLYRRVCYTFGWSAVVTFAVLNIAGLVDAVVTGTWHLRQIYDVAYFPVAGMIWILGALGQLPRVKPSTKKRGPTPSALRFGVGGLRPQPVLWLMWSVLPRSRAFDALKLAIFVGCSCGSATSRGAAECRARGDRPRGVRDLQTSSGPWVYGSSRSMGHRSALSHDPWTHPPTDLPDQIG